MVNCLAMIFLSLSNTTINEVDLNTFDWNKGAIKCYEKVGKVEGNKDFYITEL